MQQRSAPKFILFACGAAALLQAEKLPACSKGAPRTAAQMEAYHRLLLPQMVELFEAEVLKIDGDNSEMRVGRVFRGGLAPGTILRGTPADGSDSCQTRTLKPGDRGVVWTTFGPKGPVFVSQFIAEETVQSLRRIGALPPNVYAAPVAPRPIMPEPVATFDPFIVFFEWNSDEISGSAVTILNNVISICGRTRGCSALIGAHADSSGPAAYNLALSQRRARSVAAFLRRGGVQSKIVETAGETRLLNETGDGVRDAQNRRAAIWFPNDIQW